MLQQGERWIASRSLSSGAHSRDPLTRNDGKDDQCVTSGQPPLSSGRNASSPGTVASSL
jgi:hypothetical protein